jgi:hypothetical protein
LTLHRILIGLPVVMLAGAPAHADRIVDPKTVAPEFREAAEKRRAEQVKLIECNNAAKIAKIQKRDLAQFVAECFDKPADKPQ